MNQSNVGRMCRDAVALFAAGVAALSLSSPVSAAPPPPPGAENDVGKIQMREAINQIKRFEAAGLPIPTPPANGGQCVIDLKGQSGPPPGQRGASGRYRFYEIQRWEVTALPTHPGGSPLLYPFKWTTVGNGERHDDNGVGTMDDWTFGVAGSNGGVVSATKIASTGNWGIGVQPTSAPGGLVVTQQQTIVGTPPRQPGTTSGAAPAFLQFGSLSAVPAVGSPPGTPARMTYKHSWQVPRDVNWGYARPSYAGGSVSCTWTLAVGP